MEEGIQYYTEHARKTAQRLEDINSVLTDSKRQIYTPEGVDVTIKKRDKAKSMGDESVRSIAHVTARVNTGLESKKDIPDEALFRQVGKPNLDEVICFDTATKKEGQRYIRPGDDRNNVQTGDLEFEGRFIYDPKPNKSSSGRIEIVKFPECKQGECSPKFLTEARVDFAMKMVMQELVKRLNNNNPPTKEDPITIYGIKDKEIEAQYLWGACIAYGIEPDAIFVKGSSGFSPNNELDRGWLNTTVKKDGFYKKHFDDTPEKKTQLDHYTNAYKAKVEEKAKAVEASKGMDKAVASVVKRQEFADIRKDAQEREEKKKTQEAPEEISPEIAKMQQGPG